MINDKERKSRAKKAGKASGKSRSKDHKQRNKNIYLAYIYLSSESQKKTDHIKAINFLKSKGASINIRLNEKNDLTPFRILADCMKLPRSRIKQIVDKERLNQ